MNPSFNGLAAIASQQEVMEKLLLHWCSINSGSHNLPGLERMLGALSEAFSILPGKQELLELPLYKQYNELGETTLHSTGKALCITNKPDAPIQILFSGHMDTVYGPDHPFQSCKQIETDKINGPGIADMKGGLLIMLKALEAFEQHPLASKVGWQILISPDEEIGSPSSTSLLTQLAQKHHLGLVFEPSLPDGYLIRSRKGSGVFTFIAHGLSAHAGRDHAKGRNAILFLSEFLRELNKLNKEIPETIVNIGTIQGGTVVNIVPDQASAKVNIRTNNNTTINLIQEKIHSLIQKFNTQDGLKIEMFGNFTRPAKEVNPAIEHLFKEIQNCGKELKLDFDWRDTGGVCDGNTLANAGLPNIDNLGVRGDNIHSDKEYLITSSLVERTQLTYLFLTKLASGEITLPPKLFNSKET